MASSACQGQYRAQSIPGNIIVLVAIGQHPTSGYRVWLEPYRRPNTYRLLHEKENDVQDKVTSFCAWKEWDTDGTVKTVHVEDIAGWHEVPVERVLDIKCKGGDGPFPED